MTENNYKSNNGNGNGHKPGKARRSYSDKQIAEGLTILKSCNGNVLQASRESGVPRKTLERWAKTGTQRVADTGEDLAEIGHITDQTMISQLESLIGIILKAAPDKIPDAPFGQTMTGLGIALDKRQLLQGKPTSITGTDAATRAKKLIADYKAEFPKADDAEAIRFLAPEFPEVRELGKIG